MRATQLSHSVHDQGIASVAQNLFYENLLLTEPPYSRTIEWNSEVDHRAVFDRLPRGLQADYGTVIFSRLYEEPDLALTVYIKFRKENQWALEVSGQDEGNVKGYMDDFVSRVPVIKFDDQATIPITFWALDSHGSPRGILRKVASHYWDVIQHNYPTDVRSHLARLMNVTEPGGSGKLVLWHGPPGTGKTNCIRALAHAWREWCDVDYVVDPEELFGRAHYMMSTLVENHRGDDNRWRLIVIEDSAEFLRKDANTGGQSFGRLLNLTDGLVGQGLKLLMLVTTNEPFGELHPAIARAGRCLAHLEFGLFPPDEASHWLGRSVPVDTTLADLYEALEERQTQITKDRREFRPGVYV